MHSETKYNNCYAFRIQIQQLLCIYKDQKPNTTIVMHSETKYNNCYAFRNKYNNFSWHSETEYNNYYAFRNQIQQLSCI